jgi:hypothetical protein
MQMQMLVLVLVLVLVLRYTQSSVIRLHWTGSGMLVFVWLFPVVTLCLDLVPDLLFGLVESFRPLERRG